MEKWKLVNESGVRLIRRVYRKGGLILTYRSVCGVPADLILEREKRAYPRIQIILESGDEYIEFDRANTTDDIDYIRETLKIFQAELPEIRKNEW